MAEAIAALGLATNILQMLAYGGQFVNAAWKIWNSDGESTNGFTTMRTLSKDLEDVLPILQSAEQSLNNSQMSTEANSILQLANECADVTKKMLEGLQQLGLSGTSGKRGVKAAFKQVWIGGEIKALDAQLGEFRSQLTLRLLISVRSYATKSVDYQRRILEQLDKSQSDNRELHRKVDNLQHPSDFAFGSSLISYIINAMGSNASDGLEEALQGDLLKAMYDGVGSLNGVGVSEIVLDKYRKRRLEKAFLSTLSYEGMLDRATMVAEAHQATLHWVFDKEENQPWVDLPSWLRSSEQLYWIAGKAGSGKSTLMKFLTQPISDASNPGEGGDEANQLRCTEHLCHWAGEKPLIIASFYFWAAGSKIQTTRAALFRTLLYQILSKRPDALPVASPNRWEALCLFNNDQRAFSEAELREMLLRTLSYVSRDTAVSLFVDGVDEFDGDHDELTRFFKHVIDKTPIKICMASRPWQVFEDAFQNKPGLRLEDLTYPDIKSFVTTRFQEDPGFSQLQIREANFATQLIEEVVQKASGVFLWVRLAVSSLLQGITSGDRVLDLQRRLGSLPPDLEDLYGRILDDLDPFYFEHAVQYFQILSSSSDPPPALLLWFTDEEQVDLALRLPVMEISGEDTQMYLETMRRRVNSHCKGLIEVARPGDDPQTAPSFRTPVQYMHATVKGYIESPKVQERLLRELKTPFDPYLSLCSGSLAMFKATGGTCVDLYACMRYASYVDPQNVQHMIAILDDLARVTRKDFMFLEGSTAPQPLESLIERELPPLPRAAKGHPLTFLDGTAQTFLSLALRCDVIEYVKRRAPRSGLATYLTNPRDNPPTAKRKFSWARFRRSMKKQPERSENLEPQVGWPLLLDAIQLRSTAASASIVAVLLQNGADPNYNLEGLGIRKFYSQTIWIYVLGLTLRVFGSESWDPKRKTHWGEIARLMLVNGAYTDRKTIKLAVTAALGFSSANEEAHGALVTQIRKQLRELRDKGTPLSIHFDFRDHVQYE